MRYDAFISYRHSELDMYVAKKVHKGLETLKVPRSVAKKCGKKKIHRVFRDQEELPIGSDLGNNIETALSQSEFLIVICSPRTPQSEWVMKEITTFIAMHGRDHVLAILIEGEPSESFPKPLLEDEQGNPVEPLAADVRGTNIKEVRKKLKTEILRLAAPVLGCSFDDLRQRHRERRLKKIAAIATAAACLGIAFGAYSAYQTSQIQLNLQERQKNQSRYLADTALSLAEQGQRKEAVLVALEGLPSEKKDRPFVSKAQYALSTALRSYQNGNDITIDYRFDEKLPIQSFDCNQDKTYMWVWDNGNNVDVWDINQQKKLCSINPNLGMNDYSDRVILVSFYKEDILYVTGTTVYIYDIEGNCKRNTPFSFGVYSSASYCIYDKESQMIVANNSRELVCYGLEEDQILGSFEPGEGSFGTCSIVINDGKKVVVSGGYDKEVVAKLRGDLSFADEENESELTQEALKENPDEESKQEYEADDGYFYVLDLAAKTSEMRLAPNTGISKMVANDQFLYLYTLDDERFFTIVDSEKEIDSHIIALDLENFQEKWIQSVPLSMNDALYGSSTILKYFAYSSDTFGTGEMVLYAAGQVLSAFDTESGEKLLEIPIGADIADVQLGNNGSPTVSVGDWNGNIMFISMTSGIKSQAYYMHMDGKIKSFRVGKGKIIVQIAQTPYIYMYDYGLGEGLEVVQEYEETLRTVYWDEESKCIGICCYEDLSGLRHFYFYDMRDNHLLREYKDVEGEYFFLAKGPKLISVTKEGNITIRDIETEEITEVKKEICLRGCEYSENEGWLIGYSYDEIYFYNIFTKEEKSFEKSVDNVNSVVVSDEEQKLIVNTEDMIEFIDITSGESTEIILEGYRIIGALYESWNVMVSKDGSKFLICCSDNQIRVFDTKSKEVIDTIPFAAQSHFFVGFSDDGTRVFMQCEDMIFKIYDLNQKAFVWMDTMEHKKVGNVDEYEEQHLFMITDDKGLWVINSDNYEVEALIPHGVGYLPENEKVICTDENQLYEMPMKSLEDLREEARAYVGEETLSDWQLRKYNIE